METKAGSLCIYPPSFQLELDAQTTLHILISSSLVSLQIDILRKSQEAAHKVLYVPPCLCSIYSTTLERMREKKKGQCSYSPTFPPSPARTSSVQTISETLFSVPWTALHVFQRIYRSCILILSAAVSNTSTGPKEHGVEPVLGLASLHHTCRNISRLVVEIGNHKRHKSCTLVPPR